MSLWERNSWRRTEIAEAMNNLPSLSDYIENESVTAS